MGLRIRLKNMLPFIALIVFIAIISLLASAILGLLAIIFKNMRTWLQYDTVAPPELVERRNKPLDTLARSQ